MFSCVRCHAVSVRSLPELIEPGVTSPADLFAGEVWNISIMNMTLYSSGAVDWFHAVFSGPS